MSAPSTASPPIVRRSSRKQNTYENSPQPDRHHRVPSASGKSPTSGGPARSSSQSYNRSPSSQQSQLANVVAKDSETTNVARPLPSQRQIEQDRTQANGTRRSDSMRDSRRTPSRGSYSHPESRSGGDGQRSQTSEPSRSARDGTGSSGSAKKRTTISAQTGQWSLGKTIGAGSMGKVKLAKNLETGEQVAVKIVPRQSTDEHRSDRDRERADHSKEVRTAREAAIVTLLNHPYVCAMRDVQRTNYHWYMLFEYVNGGQMLDYIISHGKLKEKQARKFGRQVASALDYCHRNSIVHRDLKIENILISKTGDIKIIDFGLSNLFSPRSALKTFCGSLYFAAPELLQARQYTGPEVDIWSFGIVLYVLVCGKVPFDDQSMPQLHAKIKKGAVDYPNHLSFECKSLISRMLVTDPRQRASLAEIMNHPWMTKGFNSPPENYLPQREPLQLPLDSQVIEKMTGFDFGPVDYITRELTRIVGSDEYQAAIRNNAREQAIHASATEQKRGVLHFYKRRNSTTSRDTLPNTSSEAVQLGTDPVNAYHPLISIYYLVREKQERERSESNPGALAMPISQGEKPLRVPDLPAPEAAHTNASTYEMPGEKPTGGRARARSRTQGEDDVTENLKKVQLAPSGQTGESAAQPPEMHSAKKESTGMGILRRLSTRRGRDYRSEPNESQPAPSLQVQPPADGAPSPGLRKSFSMRKPRNRDRAPTSLLHPGGSTPHQAGLLSPDSPQDSRVRTANKINRSASVNSADYRLRHNRRGVSEGQPGRSGSPNLEPPPLTSGSEKSSVHSDSRANQTSTAPSDRKSMLPHRASTTRARSLGYAAKESLQIRRPRREEDRPADLPEETSEDLVEKVDNPNKSVENIKPVYLKGLFSVSTTSNKPLPVIRMDIVRVLNQLSVSWTEIKGGFSCHHAASIDLNKGTDNQPPSPEPTNFHKRRISFAGNFRSDRGTEESEKPRRTNTLRKKHPQPDVSFTASSDSESDFPRSARRSPRNPPPAAKIGDKAGSSEWPSPAAGETTTHVQHEVGENMVLRFEIFIVKVPLFSLHGIQFKKVQGGTWQYKEMASKILDALKL